MWGSAKIAPRITPAPSHPKVMLPLRLTRLGCRREVESGPMKARGLARRPQLRHGGRIGGVYLG